MADAQTAAEVIRDVVLHGRGLPEAQLRALAEQYEQQYAATVARLRECIQLLTRGLRAEAIELAEREPPVLDLLATLEFQGADAWRAYAAENSWPAPTKVDPALVTRLDEQYTQQASLEPLVNAYRRASVKNAPAVERMRLLRKLHQADPGNANWVSDLQSLEAARVRELGHQLERQAAVLSEDAARAVVAELTATDRLTRPPEELVTRARQVCEQKRRQRFERQCEKLTADLNDAYGAMDVAAGAAASTTLKALMEREGLPLPPRLSEQVQDAQQWLDERLQAQEEQAAFERDCEQLEKLLNEKTRASEFQRLLQRLEAYGRDLPEGLGPRAHNRLQILLTEEQRRHRAKMAAVCAACVLAVALVAAGTWYVMRRSEAVRVAAQIDAYRAQKDAAGGAAFIKAEQSGSPGVMTSSDVSSAVARFEEFARSDAQRAAELRDLTARLDQLTEGDAEYAAERERAKALCVTAAERDALATAEAQAHRRRLEEEQRSDAKVMPLLTDAVGRLTALKGVESPQDAQAILDDLDGLLLRVEQTPHLSAETLARAQELRQRQKSEVLHYKQLAANAAESILRHQRFVLALKAARLTLPDVTRYAKELRGTAAANPTEPECASLDAWTSDLGAYQEVVRVASGLQRVHVAHRDEPWKGRDGFAVADYQTNVLKERAQAASPYAQAFAAMATRADFLSNIVAKADKLRKLLNHPMVRTVYQLEVRQNDDTTTYYGPIDGDLAKATAFTLHCYDDQNRLVGPPPQRLWAAPPTRAPHCRLADTLSQELDTEQVSSDWFSSLPTMISQVLQDDSANPRVRMMLLNELLTLNTASGDPAGIPATVTDLVAQQVSSPLNFLAPSSATDVARELTSEQKRLADLKKRLAGPLAQPQHGWKLMLSGAYRRLIVSAVAVGDADGKPGVMVLADTYPEYWSLVHRDGGIRFAVAARQQDGKIVLLRHDLVPGQPLFSPQDRASTRALFDHYKDGLETDTALSVWPVNVHELDGGAGNE